VNFFVLLVLLLTNNGYVSPLASLHQFVTNPTLEEQNGTQMVQAYHYRCIIIQLLKNLLHYYMIETA